MTGPRLIDASNLEAELAEFAAEREWQRFHSPKNLAMALTAEVGELVEHFQWITEEESRRILADSQTAEGVKDELADVLLYLVRLASVLGVDLDEVARAKLIKNSARYPARRATPGPWGGRP
ncbi:MAG TPA: nucleotide pyrophosphohydrolase [Caldimonas sp.]|jgi:NTP pyrophosphatase (non-canonical NTP hydrolase)|nr:nucleotide pyrophosphohydrolase [Caldimonas sp.]HEX2541232.1 nucleotide pyrophosphohydrolase [Caldimonas sp.]